MAAKDVVVDFLINLDDKNFTSSMNTMKGSVAGFIKSAAPLVAGAGILGTLGAASVKMAATFDQSFAKVSTLFGGVEVDTDNLKKQILELSTSTGIAADELNEGLYSALSAGIPVTEDMGAAIDFLSQATKLSVAGFTSVEKAVDVTTTVLNAYGREVGDAESIMNTLIETQNAGKTTVDQLASSLGNVIPAAAATNVEFEDLAAMMAVMTANGVATSESATKLKALFVEMQKPTSKLNELSQELWGQTIPEAIKEGGDFEGVMKALDGAIKDQGKSWIEYVSSTEAADAANILMKDGGEAMIDVMRRIKDGTFELNDAYETMQTPAQNWAKIQEGINNSLIEMGDEILNTLNPALEYLADNIDTIAPVVIKTTAALGAFLVVIGTMGMINITVGILQTFKKNLISVGTTSEGTSFAFSGLTNAIINMGSVFINFSKLLGQMSVDLMTYKSSVDTTIYGTQSGIQALTGTVQTSAPIISSSITTMLGGISGSFSTFATTISTSFTTMFTGIGASIGTFLANIATSFATGFGFIGTVFSGLASSIGTAMTAIVGFIGLPELAIAGLIAAFIALVLNVGGARDKLIEIMQYLSDNWAIILQNIIIMIGNFAIQLVGALIIAAIQGVTAFINGAINAFTTGFGILATVVSRLIMGFVGFIGGVFLGGLQSLSVIVSNGMDSIEEAFRSGLDYLINQSIITFNSIREQINIMMDSITRELSAAWDSITGVFDGALTFLQGLVTLDFDKMKAGIIQIWNSIKQFFIDTWNNIKITFRDSLNNLKTYVSQSMDNIKSTILDIWNNIKSFFSDTWNDIRRIFQNTIDSIKAVVISKFNAIKSFFTEIGAAWSSTFSNTWNKIKNVFSSSISSITSNATSKFSALSSKLSGIMNTMNSFFQVGWEKAKSIFSNAVSSIYDSTIGKLEDLLGAVGRLVGKIGDKVSGALSSLNPFKSAKAPIEEGVQPQESGARGATRGANAVGTTSYSGGASTVPKLANKFGVKLNKLNTNNFGTSGMVKLENVNKTINIEKLELTDVDDPQELIDELLELVDTQLLGN